jgi:hypothetical protein
VTLRTWRAVLSIPKSRWSIGRKFRPGGGSHGIGKAAPLACSDLRTIFVSTIWKEKRHTKSLVQGRAVLMSFTKSDGIYKSTGYWGDADAYQALEPKDVPENIAGF